jgi:hypothetical protein
MVLVPNEESAQKVLRLIEMYGKHVQKSCSIVEYLSFSIALSATSRIVVFNLVNIWCKCMSPVSIYLGSGA